MGKLISKWLFVAAGVVVAIPGMSGVAEAARIKSTIWSGANGNDAGQRDTDARYKFHFLNGDAHTKVNSIVLDLRSGTDTNAVFGSHGKFSKTISSSIGGIKHAFSDDKSKLTFTFAEALKEGDYFEFRGDTQFLGNNAGGAWGSKGLKFQVNWQKYGVASNTSSTFQVQSSTDSMAEVPEPTAILATLAALGFGFALRRQGKGKVESLIDTRVQA